MYSFLLSFNLLSLMMYQINDKLLHEQSRTLKKIIGLGGSRAQDLQVTRGMLDNI